MIQKLYSKVRGHKLSARTVGFTYVISRSALQQVVCWRMLPFNAADTVDLPK